MKISKRSARQHCSANVKHGAGWRPWRAWSFLFILPSVLRAEACQAKAGFHWCIVKVIIRSVNKDLVKTQCCDFAHDSVIYDQVKTRLSGLQAEAVELNHSHCDWFILPTLTIWFLLDCKWQRAKSEDSNSVTHMTLLMTLIFYFHKLRS